MPTRKPQLSPFFFLLCFFVAVLQLSLVSGWAIEYVIEDDYSGQHFFDNFTFQTFDYCGCQGAANFTTYEQALRKCFYLFVFNLEVTEIYY